MQKRSALLVLNTSFPSGWSKELCAQQMPGWGGMVGGLDSVGVEQTEASVYLHGSDRCWGCICCGTPFPSGAGIWLFCVLSSPSHAALVSSLAHRPWCTHLSSLRSPSLRLTSFMGFLNVATVFWTQSCRCGLTRVNSIFSRPSPRFLSLKSNNMFHDVVFCCCLTLEVWPVCHRGTFYLIFLSLVPTACLHCFSLSSGITKRFLGLGPGDSEGTRTRRGPALPEPGFRQAEQQLCLWAGSRLCCAGVTDLPAPLTWARKDVELLAEFLKQGCWPALAHCGLHSPACSHPASSRICV